MKTSFFNSNKFYIPLVVLLLVVMFFMEFTSALQESQTIDEGSHLSSGYSYITTGDFRMNPEHPPLIKELSALPLLFLQIKAPLNHPSWREQNQWEFGRQFLYNNTVDADLILLLGRIPIMLLSLLLGVLVYKWAGKLWGRNTGLIALLLYVFEPNILAHSRYVTTDLGATLIFFLTIYLLDKYFIKFSKKSLIFFVISISIAQLIKFSALILYVFFLIFAVMKILHHKTPQLTLANITKTVLLMLLFLIIIGTAVYGFSSTIPMKDVDIQYFYNNQISNEELAALKKDDPIIYELRSIADPQTKSGEIIYNIANNVAIPSFYFLKGLFTLFSHNYWGHMSYLHGEYSNFGFWNYFPTTFLIKTPIPMIMVLVLGFFAFLSPLYKKKGITQIKNSTLNLIPSKYLRAKLHSKLLLGRFISFYRNVPFTYWLIILTPLLYFLWAMTSKINIGHRHVLVIYPFLILLSARIITKLFSSKRIWLKFFAAGLVIWYVASSILIYPNFLSYFNESIGGPKNGAKFVTDSNLDWGQDVIKLKKYLDDNKITEYYFTYFGSLWTSYYGIPFQPVPRATNQQDLDKLDRVVAISVSALYSEDGTYKALRSVEPDARVGFSINIYNFPKTY
ncbi:MAG: glycosyltransferase family 39 protein [Patescibacteria group bacterium]